jgi:hypothetical protein
VSERRAVEPISFTSGVFTYQCGATDAKIPIDFPRQRSYV